MNRTNQDTPHTIFIALSGKKQVGKDTAAKIIMNMLLKENKSVHITAFAAPLKEMCKNILGLSFEGVYGTDEQKNTMSHILWDGFPLDIRLKYSSQSIKFTNDDGTIDEKDLPRIGPMTNREVLQVMGTDIFRTIYNDVWANAPFNQNYMFDVVILTDCRFPNEKLATERAGGVIIRLERSTGFSDNHPSETALDDIVFENTYYNDGSLEDLERYLKNLLIFKGIVHGTT